MSDERSLSGHGRLRGNTMFLLPDLGIKRKAERTAHGRIPRPRRLTLSAKGRIILGVGSLAQLAEQLTLNQLVDGSIPSRPTNNFKALR